MRRNDMTVHRLAPADMLDRGLSAQADQFARPPDTARVVFADVLRDAFGGVGGGVLAWIALSATGAPDSVLWTWPLLAGAGVCGGLLILDATKDNFRAWRNGRQIRQAFRQLERDVEAERADWQHDRDVYLDALDEAAARIGELERGLNEMTKQRDLAVYDLSRERQNAQTNGRNTYVPPVEIAPQELADAAEMLRYYYANGVHLSRRKAADAKRWSQPRWEAALQLLQDANALALPNGAPQYPQTLDEALRRLGDYMVHARGLSAPAINRAVGANVYVELDEG